MIPDLDNCRRQDTCLPWAKLGVFRAVVHPEINTSSFAFYFSEHHCKFLLLIQHICRGEFYFSEAINKTR